MHKLQFFRFLLKNHIKASAVDCVVFSLLFDFSFLNERCVLTLPSTADVYNATFPVKQAGRGCVNLAKVGKL